MLKSQFGWRRQTMLNRENIGRHFSVIVLVNTKFYTHHLNNTNAFLHIYTRTHTNSGEVNDRGEWCRSSNIRSNQTLINVCVCVCASERLTNTKKSIQFRWHWHERIFIKYNIVTIYELDLSQIRSHFDKIIGLV